MSNTQFRKLRIPSYFIAVMLAALITGCASSQNGNAEYHAAEQERLKNVSCPDGTTAVCVDRAGQHTLLLRE